MEKLLYIVSVMMTMMLMAGCRRMSQMSLLVEAEMFLPAEPDSADGRLKMIDVHQLGGDEEEALYTLLRTMTDAMQRKQPLNDSLVQQAYAFYSSKSHLGSSSDQTLVRHFAQSALYMGDWYAEKDSIKASEDSYRQAIKYSEKTEDWHTCYIAYERLATQVQWNNLEEALELNYKAIEICERCYDSTKNLLSLYSYASNYAAQLSHFKNGDFQESLNLAYKVLNISVDSCWEDYQRQAKMLLAKIFWLKKDYNRALEWAKKCPPPDLSTSFGISQNEDLARYYLYCDSLEQAKELYKAPARIEDKTDSYLYASSLAELYIKLQNADSAVFFMDSAFLCSEQMYFDALQAKDNYYQDNLEKERRNEELLYIDKLKTWGFGVLAFILLTVSSFAAWVITLKLRMHREKLNNAQEEMALMKEKQAALEDSQQKKAATIKYLQRYIIDQAEVTLHLKDTTSHVKMSAKNWNDVEQLLDEIDDGRISKIRAHFKTLSIDDIRLCVMVRLGMSNPAIGNVYGITPSAVQHRKLALKKKGFGITDPEVTLDRFLESL